MIRMTLFSLLKDCCVSIPSLQRNYVHGKDDTHAKEVREHFVKSLDGCINGSEINLDVIYGVCDDTRNVLIPIDGQQRLTTLWLSAVYAATKSKDNALRLDLLSKLSRFSYESRPLAATFCRWLTSGADVNYDTALLQAEDCWGEDPTVHSMITTLRLIHEKFRRKAGDLLKVLCGDKIYFEFSEVHGKDSDLYVKINARGKQLTQWENFKGAFASQLPNDDVRKSFESRIEELSDKYFNTFNAIPDKAFFSLFGRVADYYLRNGNSYAPEKHENLLVLAKGVECYVPVEEFGLKYTAKCIVGSILRIIEWALSLDQTIGLWYWENGEKSRSVAETLFTPENDNERDFALFLFEYFSKYEKGDGLCINSYRALRYVANILENVARENAMRSEENGCSPKKQFNRIDLLKKVLENSENLYCSQRKFSENVPIQLNEEFAKGEIYGNGTSDQIKLLQECESYMHGRVRIALLVVDVRGEKWNSVANIECRQKRLAVLKEYLDAWHTSDEQSRVALLRHVISCEPWNIKDQILLSLGAEALRKILSTRDDIHLQKTYLDGSPSVDVSETEEASWRRDWRKNVFEVDDWKDRTVKWHGGTGIYFLYAKGRANISYAMPVSDWRFDLRKSISNDFADLGQVESVSSNDGGTRSFKCELAGMGGSRINIYLWKERVEIRWFQYDGNLQKSDWIEISSEEVNGATLATEIKNRIKKLKEDLS